MTDITKWTEILTAEDVAKEQRYAAKIRWAFSAKSLNAQIDRFEAGDDKEKCKVYFLLEDCNFHEVAGLLANYGAAWARKWVKDNL